MVHSNGEMNGSAGVRRLFVVLFVGSSLGCAPQIDLNDLGRTSCADAGPPPPHSTMVVSSGCTTWMCDPGWADCGRRPCSIDVTSDPQNCGECGNTCATPACVSGSCQRVDTLAADLTSPVAIAVDADHVYVVDQTSIGWMLERASLDGSNLEMMGTYYGSFIGVAVDTTGVYGLAQTTTGGAFQLVQLPSPTGSGPLPPVVVAPDASPGLPISLALGGGSVWWLRAHPETSSVGADGGLGAATSLPMELADLLRASETDFTATVVATVPGGQIPLAAPALAIGGGDAFVASGNNLLAVRSNATTVQTLATEAQPISLVATDDTDVYWTAGSPDVSSPSPVLRGMPWAGGTPRTLGKAWVRTFVPRDGLVWAVESGSAAGASGRVGDVLVRIGADGSRTVLAGGQATIGSVAIDSTSVYWIERQQGQSGSARVLRTDR